MTSQDDFLYTNGQNTQRPDDPPDSSSEDKVYGVPLQRSTQCKRPAPAVVFVFMRLGECSIMNYLLILSDPVVVLPVDVQ